jgi:hypothetical protein
LVSVQPIVVLSCRWFGWLHPDEFGYCFPCFLLVHHYRIVCMYRQHGTVVSVHLVHSTDCTMLIGPVSHYCIVYMYTLHGTWCGSFCTPAVQYCLYHFAVIAVSHLFVFANSSIRLSLLSLLFFPLS